MTEKEYSHDPHIVAELHPGKWWVCGGCQLLYWVRYGFPKLSESVPRPEFYDGPHDPCHLCGATSGRGLLEQIRPLWVTAPPKPKPEPEGDADGLPNVS
jgi:hypothetical protein